MSKKGRVLATVACGTFMATLDSSIVNIALPTLTKVLHTDLRSIKWVIVVYLLTITCTLLPFGRFSDLYGRKRVFQWGFIVFTIGSLLCGFSTTLQHLILARIFQGLGASMLMSNGPAIVTQTFAHGSRGKALGILSMVVSTGLVSGPSVGGALIGSLGWRSIFLVNIPIGLLGFVFAGRNLDPMESKKQHGPFDWGGAFLQMLVLLLFILFVDPPNFTIADSKPIFLPRWLLGIALAGTSWIFYTIQKQVPEPILDFSLFKIRTFWAANLANFLNFVSYSSLLVLMPFYLEEVLSFDPEHAGFLMSAIPLTVFVIAPISGHLSDRIGTRYLCALGALIAATTLLFMSGTPGHGLSETTTQTRVVIALLAIGLSSGLFQSPNNVALMSSIPADKLGLASALMATIRNLGLVTGTGLAAKLFSWRHTETGDFVKSFHFSLMVAGLFSLGAMMASLAKRDEIAPIGEA
ncbi:MAG: MFS transporter [Cryobacterium sp.]|nr:MFS transporter [Oligoflexia bacterium]